MFWQAKIIDYSACFSVFFFLGALSITEPILFETPTMMTNAIVR